MKQIDELIRGELAAVISIDSIIDKVKAEERRHLESIRKDHVSAVDKLKMFAHSDFVEEAESPGPWGAFTSAVTKGASIFGDRIALEALKLGEEHGINEYREVIRDDAMNPELRRVIESELIPNQEKHLALINQFLH